MGGLHQQGDVKHQTAVSRIHRVLYQALVFLADQGVNDLFQAAFGTGVTEDQCPHVVPVHGAIGRYGNGAKLPQDGWNTKALRRGQTARNSVGVHHRRPAAQQVGRHRRFATANAAGQPDPKGPQHVALRCTHGKADSPTALRTACGPNTMALSPAPARNGPKGM